MVRIVITTVMFLISLLYLTIRTVCSSLSRLAISCKYKAVPATVLPAQMIVGSNQFILRHFSEFGIFLSHEAISRDGRMTILPFGGYVKLQKLLF